MPQCEESCRASCRPRAFVCSVSHSRELLLKLCAVECEGYSPQLHKLKFVTDRHTSWSWERDAFARASAWMKESTVIQNNCVSWRILEFCTQLDWKLFTATNWKMAHPHIWLQHKQQHEQQHLHELLVHLKKLDCGEKAKNQIRG